MSGYERVRYWVPFLCARKEKECDLTRGVAGPLQSNLRTGRQVDCRLSLPLSPERHAAGEAGLVGNDFDVFTGLEVELLGVAPAEIEMIPVEELVGLFDHL